MRAHRSGARVRSPHPDNDQIAESQMGLGRALTDLREYARAESLLRAAVASRERLLDAGDVRLARARLALGVCLARWGRGTEAAALIAPNLPRVERLLGTKDRLVRDSRGLILRRPVHRRPAAG